MKIIVAGCGKIGTVIVSSLVKEGHDVVAMDVDQNIIAELTNIYDVMGVCGNCADSDALVEAGAQKAELLVAVTDSDEINMLSCFLAGKLGTKNTIARIRNPEYNDSSLNFMKQHLGLSMAINPELLTAEELYKILRLPTAAKIETFSRRNFELVELYLKGDESPDGLTMIELKNKYPGKYLIGVVQREDEVFIPDGRFVLKNGDRIGVLSTPPEIAKLLKSWGLMQKQARNVMILGGSRIAYYLGKMLEGSGNSVKIIEQDEELCKELCELLPKSVVLQGDGAQEELLLEEGLGSQDAFIALTGMDEENILLSIFASTKNVPKVIAKVNKDELADLAGKMGLESIISPKHIIADILVRYARAIQNSLGSNVETLYKLMDDKAEAVEFIVCTELPFLNTPLKQLKFKKNILIGGIIRDRKTIIPSGDDIITVGDRVVVLAAGQTLNDFSDIIAG